MILFNRPLRIAALLAVATAPALATAAFPHLFSDHMVIQRELPVHVWGTADPGEQVNVRFHGATRTAAADSHGRWSVYFEPAAAGGPFELQANGVTLHDVMVGDVWVASGQSNMEWVLRNANDAANEVAHAQYPQIRQIKVENASSEYPLADIQAKGWTPCNPETAGDFSAVAYFFARDLYQKYKVPIGIISSNWGGTPADAWTSLGALSADASLMPVFASWNDMMRERAVAIADRERQLAEWNRQVERAKAEGKPAPQRPWAPNENQSWRPAALYNAMIAPLTPAAIKGVIWYQGESNASAERAPVYARLFQTMIRDWRQAWNVGDFPFLFVQLANFKTGPNSWWPMVRDAQLQTLSLANTGMAVTIDIGNPDDIHPRNKQDVGHRLALAARAIGYGEKIEYSGPLYRQTTAEADGLRVWFDHAAGLRAKAGAVRGFEIAGADKKFVPAEARIEGATVVVTGVASPKYVRYAWKDVPEATLVNGEGLPASPFRSE